MDRVMMKIVRFSSPTCQPCEQAGLVVDEVVRATNVSYEDLDVSIPENRQRARRLGVLGVPTVIVLNDDMEILRISGMKHNMKDQLIAILT